MTSKQTAGAYVDPYKATARAWTLQLLGRVQARCHTGGARPTRAGRADTVHPFTSSCASRQDGHPEERGESDRVGSGTSFPSGWDRPLESAPSSPFGDGGAPRGGDLSRA